MLLLESVFINRETEIVSSRESCFGGISGDFCFSLAFNFGLDAELTEVSVSFYEYSHIPGLQSYKCLCAFSYLVWFVREVQNLKDGWAKQLQDFK